LDDGDPEGCGVLIPAEAERRHRVESPRTAKADWAAASEGSSRAPSTSASSHAAAGGAGKERGGLESPIDASGCAPCFGPEKIGLGHRRVVAGNDDVEIVVDRERESVLEGELHLSILDEFMKPGEFAKELSDTDGLRYDPKTRAPTEVGL